MPRPIWKGAISFGLVTIPIGLYSAVERKNELSFRLLHDKDKSPIDYKRFCEEEGVEVPWSEIVKGYEYEKGRYVILSDKDFERAKVPATQTFEIREFVPAGAIDFMYFDQPYYLAPTGKGAAKAYALLRDALREEKRVGVGTFVLRQREHLAALEPAGDALVLTTMRFAYEIRSADALDLPRDGWNKREMALARQLIDTLAGEWKPEDYRDTYHDVLLEAIQQKVEGKEIKIAAPKGPPRVANLVKALEQSLKRPRPLAKMEGRRKAHRGARKERHRKAA